MSLEEAQFLGPALPLISHGTLTNWLESCSILVSLPVKWEVAFTLCSQSPTTLNRCLWVALLWTLSQIHLNHFSSIFHIVSSDMICFFSCFEIIWKLLLSRQAQKLFSFFFFFFGYNILLYDSSPQNISLSLVPKQTLRCGEGHFCHRDAE